MGKFEIFFEVPSASTNVHYCLNLNTNPTKIHLRLCLRLYHLSRLPALPSLSHSSKLFNFSLSLVVSPSTRLVASASDPLAHRRCHLSLAHRNRSSYLSHSLCLCLNPTHLAASDSASASPRSSSPSSLDPLCQLTRSPTLKTLDTKILRGSTGLASTIDPLLALATPLPELTVVSVKLALPSSRSPLPFLSHSFCLTSQLCLPSQLRLNLHLASQFRLQFAALPSHLCSPRSSSHLCLPVPTLLLRLRSASACLNFKVLCKRELGDFF